MDKAEKERKEALLTLMAQVELALGYSMMLINAEVGALAQQLWKVVKFEQKKEYKALIKKGGAVDRHLEEKVWPRIMDTFAGENGEPFDSRGFDVKLFEGNELARPVLLYADKTANDNGNFEKIFTMLGEMKGIDLLDQKTYDRLYLQLYNDKI